VRHTRPLPVARNCELGPREDKITNGPSGPILLAETLEGLGHTVCAVESNVTNAVAAASYWRPDLMIVDVGLTEARGVAAVKEIVRIKFVPHVFVTCDAVRGSPLGPETVLIQKPFRVSDLERAIQVALSTAQACDRVT